MSRSSFSLAVVIPTRNRAALAVEAIRSVLAIRSFDLRVLVSDNSSNIEEVNLLSNFCRDAHDERLVYARPGDALLMGTHWDWALRHAMERFDSTHFTVHYDRKLTVPDRLEGVWRVAVAHELDVVTHFTDGVIASESFAQVTQPPSDGRSYEISADSLLRAVGAGMATSVAGLLPLLCNCITPRTRLEEVRDEFGSVCDSVAPDVGFAFRFLAHHDRVLHCHLSTGVLRAFHRSHAFGFVRQQGGDFVEFHTLWGDRPWLDAAPVPGLSLGQNMLYHEYGVVQRIVGTSRFPQIQMEPYLRDLAKSLSTVGDADTRDRMRRILEQYGWKEEPPVAAKPQLPKLHPRRIARSIAARSRGLRVSQKLALFLADRFGIAPRDLTPFLFRSEAEALGYALRFPRRPGEPYEHLTTVNAMALPPGGLA